ncbi:MAG: hypothetical protein J5833_07780, partial [Victivallales bacterium]|nr:hypothetical protein [Victivallales bacterium]
ALPDVAFLKFNTNERDFGQNVKIFGKDASGEERPLKILGDAYIFDSTSNIDARKKEVEFSPGQCRDFRVLLSEANLERRKPERSVSVTKGGKDGETTNEKTTVVEQPFNIKSLELKSIKTIENVLCVQNQGVQIPFEKVSTDDGKSIYTVKPDVFPVKGLSFEFQEENYSRNYTVLNLLKDGTERTAGVGVVGRVSIDYGERKSSGGSSRYFSNADVNEGILQITFEDNDNPPLTLKSVSLSIPLYRLKFFAKAEQFPLRLTATPNSKEPVYDTASILAIGGNEQNEMNTCIIRPEKFSGEPISAIVVDGEARGVPRTVLYIAIAVAVAVMAVALAATLKKAKVE